jgi:hypothetical protein
MNISTINNFTEFNKKTMFTNEQKKKFAEELNKRKQGMTCPMCQNRSFIMADGYFNNTQQNDLTSFSLGGPSIPTIAIVCSNCGFVSQHALGVLGLLPKEEINKSDEPTK